MGRNTGRDQNVNKSELKNKDRESQPNPNIRGEEAPNVRTDRMGTSDVPATRQKDITPKGKQDNSDTNSAT